jgi:hypothetical protein
VGTQKGNICCGPNWASNILKEIEEPKAFEHIVDCMRNQCNACDDCEHEEGNVGRTTPPILICPSYPIMKNLHTSESSSLENLAKGNYAACWGTRDYLSFRDRKTAGLFGVNMLKDWRERVGDNQTPDHPSFRGKWKMGFGQGTKVSDVRDGISKTYAISEVVGYDAEDDIRGVWTSVTPGSATYTALFPPNARGTEQQQDYVVGCSKQIPEGHPLKCRPAPDDGTAYASARSMHVGGVVAGTADAAVRFVGNDIDIFVWQAMSTRDGSEVLPREGR